MKFSKNDLPSNKKFGFFFTFVFAVTAVYFFYSVNMALVYTFITISLSFLVITLVKSDILLPLNKLWMRLGVLLSMIMSPIVLGIIFFGLFTPIALIMKVTGRDELRLKLNKNKSYWVTRIEQINSNSFKNQF